jgi:opacity protein-like surface antigen
VDINAMIGDIKPGVYFAMQRQSQLYNVAGLGEGNRNLWWVGPYVDAKMGPVDVSLDFIYNGGYDVWENGLMSLTDPANPANLDYSTIGGSAFRSYSVRHEGYLFRGVASYTMNKFKFGVGGLYGSGDNLNTLDRYEGFMTPYRSEAAARNDDFVVLTGDFGLRQPYGTQNNGGLFKPWSSSGQGVWYVRGFADYAVTDWLKLKVNGGYIGDTCSGSQVQGANIRGGDEFGTDANNDSSIGWELDAGVQINIYKNLYLDNAFGYLIAGKALAGQYGGFRAQDPWVWATTLSYQF